VQLTEVEEYDPNFPSVVVGDESEDFKPRKRLQQLRRYSPVRTNKPHATELIEMEELSRKEAEDEEVTQRHLNLCLQLAKLEAIARCNITPQEMKAAEIKAFGQRIAFLEVGATNGCCRRNPGRCMCSCCKTGGLGFM
jgi:hypothetical protein